MQMIEKNKESQNQSLTELQQELKSLKALLLSRGPTSSTAPSSPLPILGRPSIPAWQLASSPAPTQSPQLSTQATQPLNPDSVLTMRPPTITAGLNAKGKDKAINIESDDSAEATPST